MCSYLIYPSFPLIGVVGNVCDYVINLPGASGCKAQLVAPHGVISAMVPFTPLVIPYSWRSLSAPGVCSASVEFDVSSLFWT